MGMGNMTKQAKPREFWVEEFRGVNPPKLIVYGEKPTFSDVRILINNAPSILASNYFHVREVTDQDGVVCPFCNEGDFDLIDLKDHLRNYCDDFHEIKSIAEERIEREQGKK